MSRPENEKATELQPDPLGTYGVVTRASPTLRWTDAAGEHVFRMMNPRAIVGAREGVDVWVQDSKASRVHAELEVRGQSLWIQDLGSTNGTFVGGVQVGSARLAEGAVVRVGDTEIHVRLSAPPVPVALWPEAHFGNLMGRSQAMRELFAAVDRYARQRDPVLIEGETGTGKDEVARAIHDASDRADGPFIVVDCGALAPSLLESSLFGHVKGSFTGAVADQVGSIEAAHGGTVFLDEIGELPLELQPKLLRVVESQRLRRVGETDYRTVDVRFIAATHQNLRACVTDGSFREDLYFRLSVLPLVVPPLRARREDIPLLLAHFLPPEHADKVTPELLKVLELRPWRGNVRELRNFANRLTALGLDGALIGAPAWPHEPAQGLIFTEARDRAAAEFEKRYITEALARSHGDVAKAAEAAGLTASYLYKLMKRNGM